MRKVEEEGQQVDLDRKIKVEVSLAELLALKAAVGASDELRIQGHVDRNYPSLSESFEEVFTDALPLYRDTVKVLENEWICEEDEY